MPVFPALGSLGQDQLALPGDSQRVDLIVERDQREVAACGEFCGIMLGQGGRLRGGTKRGG